jgi:hypothetical protein
MIDYDDEDDIDYDDIDYGYEDTKQAPLASSSSSRLRSRFNNFSISDTPSPIPPKPSSATPKQATGGVFGFLNHTSAITTPKKDVFDFNTTKAPASSSLSSPSTTPKKIITNSALDKAEKYLSKTNTPTTTNNIIKKPPILSNADFSISGDDDDIEIVHSKPLSSVSASKKSNNFSMSSDEEDLAIDGESEEEVQVKSSSPLKGFNLKTVDDLLSIQLIILPLFASRFISYNSFYGSDLNLADKPRTPTIQTTKPTYPKNLKRIRRARTEEASVSRMRSDGRARAKSEGQSLMYNSEPPKRSMTPISSKFGNIFDAKTLLAQSILSPSTFDLLSSPSIISPILIFI